tara:strand:+ start:186 stop:407 length:222 start_codon:yes stop_codon:yes gene_type:complete
MAKSNVVVVYRKNSKSKKHYMAVFNNIYVDDVITEKRSPLLNNDYIIEEVGIGESFIESYKTKYKINKINKNG